MKTTLSELRLYLCNYIIAWLPSRRIRNIYYKKVMKFQMGADTAIFLGAFFTSPKSFKSIKNVAINAGCHLDTRGGITIGTNVSISPKVSILTGDHDIQDKQLIARFRPVIIEDDVFIGYQAIILPNVTLKRGAVVCAGAVVTKDVDEYTIVAGVPARKIGNRNTNFSRSIQYTRLFN